MAMNRVVVMRSVESTVNRLTYAYNLAIYDEIVPIQTMTPAIVCVAHAMIAMAMASVVKFGHRLKRSNCQSQLAPVDNSIRPHRLGHFDHRLSIDLAYVSNNECSYKFDSYQAPMEYDTANTKQ